MRGPYSYVDIGDRAVGGHLWWGEAPKRLYEIDEGAGLLSPKIVLRQYACRAVTYRVPC